MKPGKPGPVPASQQHAIKQSILDRLMDTDVASGGSTDGPTSAAALAALHESVRRDLQDLLNARRRRRPLDPRYTHLCKSIASYGIPDPGSGGFSTPDKQEKLRLEIEATIARHEPRLKDVTVAFVGDVGDTLGHTLRMEVIATLLADAMREPVRFETSLETVIRDVEVKRD